ncbi:MAG: hypothetical protein JO359_08090 [Candidatus Eremiobacteraeota bacterium]|nr:hypothetical protein [Candidatus Eremiobacteraeota bacterium]
MSQARDATLSESPATCASWAGPLVASYELVVDLIADPASLPLDGYATVVLTATATAN